MKREAAWMRARAALRNGELVRPTRCEDCGAEPPPTAAGNSQICAQWKNGFANWMDIHWVCFTCARHGGKPEGQRKRPVLVKTAPIPAGGVHIRLWRPKPEAMAPANLAPNEIFVSGNIIGRGQVTMKMDPTLRRVFLILAARQGRITANAELIEALWGDDANGGPTSPRRRLASR
jgi:hypothetical protein